MKVTKDGFKDRQLHIEDYLQMVSAEQKEYAEVSAHQRIAENNDIITDFQTDKLMEKILSNDNLNQAYKKVKSNKGAGGVDGMNVDELLSFFRDNGTQLKQQLMIGKYKPNPVRRVEIPKETKGEFRKLGVPTVVDRVFQQAITQVLSPIYEKQFSESSFGFRPCRGAHDALKQCQTNVNDGYVYVVDMDLEKFFDTVCQSKLIEVLSRTGLTTLDLSKFITQNVTSMNGMFYECKGLKTLDVSGFDTQIVTDMSDMFTGCSNLNSIKTFPNLQLSVALPAKMYDKGGKSYTEFPKGLSEGIWLARDVKDLPKEFSFEKVHYELREGQTCQLKLENLPEGVSASQFSFSSANPEVVTVDETGLATAVSVGTAKVEASYGEYKATCYIPVIEKGFYVGEIEDVIYTGSAVKPEVVVYDNDKILTEGVDYTIAYANNTAAADKNSKNAPKVTVTGKGNYSGKVVATFTILPYDVKEGGVSVIMPQSVLTANNKVQKPAPVVTFNGKKLAAGTDYEKAVVYTWNGKVLDPKKDIVPVESEVTVTVTGKGFYKGTMSATYRITEKSFASAKITVNKQTYTGKPIQLTAEDVKVTMGKDTLVYGVDFEVAEDSYVNNVAKGNASVTIKGKGKYGGMKIVKFAIIPKGIN